MIKSLLLTLSCVIGSGSGALQKNAPTFNNEPPRKNLIDRTTQDPYDYFYIDPLRSSHGINDVNKQKQFTTDTLKVDRNLRVAKTSQNTSISGYTIKSTLISSTWTNENYTEFITQSTLIIGFRRKGVAQQVWFTTHNNDVPYYIPNLPYLQRNGENIQSHCQIYNYNGLANDNIFNGTNYTDFDWWTQIIQGEIDTNIKIQTLRQIYRLDTSQPYGQPINYGYEDWGDYEATDQQTSVVFNGTMDTGELTKKTTNFPRMTYDGESNYWQTYFIRFHSRAIYSSNHVYWDTDIRDKYVPQIQDTVLRIDQVAPSGTTINYETVEVAPLFWQILTMPFTFIATAFNFTLFDGTPYEINPATILLALLSALVIAWILKKLITRS